MMKLPARVRRVALLAAITLLCSCSASGPTVAGVGKQLGARLLPTPSGYRVDNSPGSHGYLDRGAFNALAANDPGAAKKYEFRGGFRQDYINASMTEALSVTLLEFSTPEKSDSYFRYSLKDTLAVYSASSRGYSPIPGAVEFTGTKAYQGNWAHAVVAEKGDRTMVFAYIDTGQGPAPYEFRYWVEAQYNRI